MRQTGSSSVLNSSALGRTRLQVGRRGIMRETRCNEACFVEANSAFVACNIACKILERCVQSEQARLGGSAGGEGVRCERRDGRGYDRALSARTKASQPAGELRPMPMHASWHDTTSLTRSRIPACASPLSFPGLGMAVTC